MQAFRMGWGEKIGKNQLMMIRAPRELGGLFTLS